MAALRIATDVPAFGPMLAEAYARHWRWHSNAIAARFPAILRKFGIAGKTLADVACGEGTFARRVSRYGWRVTGTDQSPDMLALAAKKDRHGRVAWIRQDMRELVLSEPVDVATCWYNSLNYILTEPDLSRVFSSIRGALVPGGWFFCDFYTIHGLETDWADRVHIAVDDPDCWVTSETSWNPEECIATVRFVGFIRQRSRYVRFEERHRNRGYRWETVRALLEGSGLAVRGRFTVPDLAEPGPDAFRVYVATQAV